MITNPERFIIVSAAAEAGYALTAFDAALLKAGIGNVNLVKISSILPPGCYEEENGIVFPPGAFVPTAYGSICSEIKGELIAAAVGIGFHMTPLALLWSFPENAVLRKPGQMLRQ